MPNLISLCCPTCGAKLHISMDTTQFACDHCGNSYLLEQKAGKTNDAERGKIFPRTTFTHNVQQWIKAGEYEVRLLEAFVEKVNPPYAFYANVEYRNSGSNMISCRKNQWVLYDAQGYTYDATSEIRYFDNKELISLGSERFIIPGMSVRGWLAFPVASSVNLERLQFFSSFLQTKTIEFMLNK